MVVQTSILVDFEKYVPLFGVPPEDAEFNYRAADVIFINGTYYCGKQFSL